MTNIGIQRDYQNKLTGCRYAFGGLNNIIDPSNLDLEKGKLIDCVNADLDNTNSVSRRQGYEKVYTGAVHSAWGYGDVAYFIKGSSMFLFDGTNALELKTVTPDLPMEFCQCNDVIAYSNGVDFGVLWGDFSQTKTYSPDFKEAVPGGRTLEFYNGRLYYSRKNSLYCTDTFDIEHQDVRFKHVATFADTITMCKRVEDGLWVGTEKFVFFLKGDDIQEGGFDQIIVAKAGVVYGSAVKVNAEYIPESQETGTVVIFTTTAGICSGGNSGKYMNHSFNEVSFDTGMNAAAILRQRGGFNQYIVCFEIDAEKEYNPYNDYIPIEVNSL